ncbi:MAG: C39 family peptidase, partial [Nitrospirae bacterium]|nr:C39 family peptidase [Nitrospirota bacterium]
YIAGVPSFPQEPERCGPAALAMVMAFRGHPVSPGLIASEIYLPKLKGTLTVDLLIYPRTLGFESRIHRGGFPSLLSDLRQGNPVIVLLDVGLPRGTLRHYAVVVGYDAGTESVIAHSGRRANMVFPRDLFERQWRASGDWGLVVTRRDAP